MVYRHVHNRLDSVEVISLFSLRGISLSAKEWGLTFLASVLASPLLLALSLIAVAIIFIVGYITLAIFGLVSAVIYAAFGLGVIWLIGMVDKVALKKYPWIIAIVPILFVFGYIADHLPNLGLSLIPAINQSYVIGRQNIYDGDAVLLFGPYVVAVIAIVMAAVSLILSVKINNRYWWVGRKKRR